MEIWKSTYKAKFELQWGWPLVIGVFEDDHSFVDHLNSYHWTKKFCTFIPIQSEKDTCHIFFTHVGIDEAHKKLMRLNFRADIIIIIDTSDKLDELSPYDPSHVKSIEIGQLLQPNGLFLLSPKEFFDNWFELFIINLAHNSNVIEAAESISDSGFMGYDPEILIETKLDGFVSKLIQRINFKIIKTKNKSTLWKYRDDNGRIIPQPEEVVIQLRNIIQLPQWDHEKDNASAIHEVIKVVPVDLRARVVTTDSKDLNPGRGFRSDIYMSPPADADGGDGGEDVAYEPGDFGDAGAPVEFADDDLPKMEPGDHQANAEPIRETPRFLQTSMHAANNPAESVEYLLAGMTYNLKVNIGIPEAGRDRVSSPFPIPFPTQDIFNDPDTSFEKIRIHFIDDSGKEYPSTEVLLPRSGNSTDAQFLVDMAINGDTFSGEIAAYHKTRLMQRIAFQYPVFNSLSNVDTSKMRRLKLVNLVRDHFDKVSVDDQVSAAFSMIPDKNGVEQKIVVNTDEKLEQMNLADGDKKLVNAIKMVMQEISALDPAKITGLGDDEVNKLIVDLARKGNLFYSQHLKAKKIPEGRIQVESYGNYFVPLDFIYDGPTPEETAKICDHGKEALEEGACKGCFDKNTPDAKYYCPFHFWGIRREIERCSVQPSTDTGGEYAIRTFPVKGKNKLFVLKNALLGYSLKVNKSVKDQTQQLSNNLKNKVQSLSSVESWDNWKNSISTVTPETLILVVHIEEDPTHIDKVELGDEDFKSIIDFNWKLVKPAEHASPPFVILIGCEASSTDKTGYDVSSKVLESGAALVISNFTKIIGRQAATLVDEIVSSLKEDLEDTSGKEISFSNNLLRLRQKLMAKGNVAALSLVMHGDSEWKLK